MIEAHVFNYYILYLPQILMNSKIHSIIIQSSILAFTLITAGIPTLFETVLAQNDEQMIQVCHKGKHCKDLPQIPVTEN